MDGKRALKRRHDLDLLAARRAAPRRRRPRRGSRRRRGRARGRRRAAAGVEHVPAVEDVVLLHAGQPLDHRVHDREARARRDGAGRDDDAVARRSPRTSSGVASVSRRISTPAFASMCREVRRDQAERLASRGRQDQVDLPAEAVGSARASVTRWPRFARISAAFMPGGPPADDEPVGRLVRRTQRADPEAAPPGRRPD